MDSIMIIGSFPSRPEWRWSFCGAQPEWAGEFGAATWGQFFLKFILAHPAVTCIIPATRKPKHLLDNMESCGSGILGSSVQISYS